MSELYNSVLLSQLGNEKQIILLCKKFKPLLRKYSNKLAYFGAYNELLIEFMNCIFKMPIHNPSFINHDEVIIAYIEKSIKNTYILLNRKNCKIRNSEQPFTALEYALPERNTDFQMTLLIIDISNALTAYEFKLFKLKYFYNYTDKELAKKENISRQAITKRMKKIRNKLKNALFD